MYLSQYLSHFSDGTCNEGLCQVFMVAVIAVLQFYNCISVIDEKIIMLYIIYIGWSVTSQNRLKSLKTLTCQTRSDFSLPNQLEKVF